MKHNILAWFTTVVENVLQVSHFPLDIAELIYKYCFDAWYFICAFDTRYSSAGWHAMESTFTVTECDQLYSIIDVIHVAKERTTERQGIDNEIRSASSMLEGIAL